MSNQDPYTNDPYGQQAPQPYGQQPAQPYGQMPYDKQMPVPGIGLPYGAPPPQHPSSTTAMVLGLVGLIGAFVLCGVTLVLSPFAWAVGGKAVKQIDASQGRIGGRDQANIGRITGIIGTVLLILAVLALVAFLVLVLAFGVRSGVSYDTSLTNI